MGQITGADLLAIRSQAASAKDYAATCHANADRLSQAYLALQVENVKLRAKVDSLADGMRDVFPAAHRLALELECLLLSCTDTAATAKWWDSAHEALEQWREFCREDDEEVGAGRTALEVHGTVFFKDNHQYRSQLRFPIADGAYELVKIENPDMTHPLFHVAGESFECSPSAEGEANNAMYPAKPAE